MKKGMTLLELTIVLMIVSLVAIIILPGITAFSTSREESFKNRLSTLLNSSFSLSSSPTICINFKKNSIAVGKNEVPLPSGKELQTLVMPGKLISGEIASKFCFSESDPTVLGAIARNGESYYVVEIFLPVGEVNIIELSQSEVETFKDKISKGRITEWFSYY